jgi:three-Cys-motif partner protein
MAQRAQAFGGSHTELKLQIVMEYLESYLKVMRNQKFRLSYIDAFAGTGWRRAGARDDTRQGSFLGAAEARKGSALRVFDLRYQGRAFDRFVFGDLSRPKLRDLELAIMSRFPDAPLRPSIEFHAMNADQLIAAECDRMGTWDRAVMFLDPFGMQVSWSSIERVAASGKIDLWYLAPTGAAYARLMQLNGRIPQERSRRLDEALGGRGWDDTIYQSAPDLLGGEQRQRERGHEGVIAFFEGQWRKLFDAGALPHGIRLHRGGQLPYLLCFACSNPRPSAQRPAIAIANHLAEKALHGDLL